jgi:O-succinylbenzoate synthase
MVDSGEALQSLLESFRGNRAARAALDIAWWNLVALTQNKPLYQLLGGQSSPVALSTTLGVTESIEALFDLIRLSLSLGYQIVSLKFRPGWDVEMLRGVRQAFPDAPLAIDCDGLCTLGQQEMFHRLDDFFLKYIEQPLAADDLVGHAMLQENLRTPIMLDQSVSSLARVEQALDLGSCRNVRIDLARVGGLTPALAIRAVCEATGMPCAVGAACPGVPHMFAALALATLPNFALPAETFCHFEWPNWVAGGCRARFEGHEAGKLAFVPSEEPGVGIAIDAGAVARSAVEQATLR